MLWHKRQTLADLKSRKPEFIQLMQESKRCMSEHQLSQSLNASDVKKAIKCEVIHPQTLTPYTNFTFHTHPSNITYPSEADIRTTDKVLKKPYLAIGVVPQNKVFVYHVNDNFKKPIAIF